MRVIHCPIEIAGQMGVLCKYLKQQHFDAVAYNTFHTYLGYQDHLINVDMPQLEALIPELLEGYDLFHFHYAATMSPEFSDLEQIARMGKPMIMHHWGNDVRTEQAARMGNPYAYAGDSPPAGEIDRKLRILSAHIKHAIVQDYEVYPYVSQYYEHVHVLPIAFNVQSVTPLYPSADTQIPLVIHAPTNPLFKGTAPIEAAVQRLQAEGIRFDYRRIEKMSNEQALQSYRDADIVIDQILCGSYGMLAVETMSLGKPVVGFIREDLASSFPEVPPIASCHPDSIYTRLKQLILDPALRRRLGEAGRIYAEKYHDAGNVAKQLAGIYSKIVMQ
jgi:glycosyltransferase involved in cell wall biosynthesis